MNGAIALTIFYVILERAMDEGWNENANGNWVLIDAGDLTATGYAEQENSTGAVWNGAAGSRFRRLKVKFDRQKEAIFIAKDALGGGGNSPRLGSAGMRMEADRER